MKHTIRTRVGGALLSFAMVLSLLPVSALAVEDPSVDPAEGSSTSAPAEGTQGSQAGTASDPTKQSIIEIDSNDDLVNAIKEQADGQTWVFTKKGTYDVKNTTTGSAGNYSVPEGVYGYPFAFPIYANNLTITKADGVGDVTITSSYTPAENSGGNWHEQNFITIYGVGVTIDGVNLKANQNLYYGTCNKVIELTGDAKDFTLSNVNIIPLAGDEGTFGGSIYFGVTDAGTSKIENVTMDAWISASNVAGGTITIDGLTQDFSNSQYAGYSYEGYGYAWNPTVNGTYSGITVSDYTIIVDDKTDLANQVFTDKLRDGTTIQLKPGDYNLNPNSTYKVEGQTGWYMPITADDITIQGIDESGNVITDAAQTQANLYSSHYSANSGWPSQNLITVWGDDVVFEGVTIMNKIEPNKAIEVVGSEKAMDFTVRNCKFAPISEDLLKGLDSENLGGYTYDEYDEFGASLYFSARGKYEINANVTDNWFDHSTISLGAATKGTYNIAGNNFDGEKNLNNETVYSTIGYQGKWLSPDPDCTTLGDAKVNISGNDFEDAGAINFSQVTEGDNVPVLSGNNGLNESMISGPVKVDGEAVVNSEAALKVALESANPGDIITLNSDIVLSDTLNISKDITIDGQGHTISTTAIDTQIDAINGESIKYSAIIAATNDADVVLKNLIVKGDPEKASADADLTHNTRYIGVAAINANLTMEGCKILDITYTQGPAGLQGMQNGFGVYAVSNSTKTLTLNNTEIANFNKTAVIARSNIDLKMNGCTITGFGEQAIIGQNGIQYAGNATIQNTKISGLIYNAENEWKNCSTAIYNVSTGTTTNTVLQNVVCENVDSSYYTTGGTTSISSGSFVHVGDGNAAVAGDEGVSIVITGGKFDSNVNKYLAPGYVMDSNGNVYNPSTGGGSSSTGDYLITVDKTTGGKVTVNPGRADKGDEVTITVKPNDGYELDQLSVTDKDGDSVKVTNKGNGKYTFTMPGSQITIKATFKAAESSALDNFTDVNSNAWYADAVEFVIEEGLMTGTSDTTFAPDTSMSRAMIWTVLAAYNGANTSGGNPWYAPSQQWAMINGVSDGSAPNGSITREQLAVMLWRAAGSPSTSKNLTGYADANAVSDWAVEALAWAVDNGIISGMSGSSLAPQNTATRAQVAVMLMQFVECMDA